MKSSPLLLAIITANAETRLKNFSARVTKFVGRRIRGRKKISRNKKKIEVKANKILENEILKDFKGGHRAEKIFSERITKFGEQRIKVRKKFSTKRKGERKNDKRDS